MPPQRMGWPARNIGQSGMFGPNPRGMAAFGQQPGLSANRGLLARLFSRQAAPEAASMFARSGGTQTSLLQGLTNPQTIGNFLGKTQNVLNTAQQIGPLIQQYGPMVKNLPAMWRIYQGLTSSSADASSSADESADVSSTTPEQSIDDLQQNLSDGEIEEDKKKNKKADNTPTPTKKERKKGESVPKLYIPS